MDREAWSAAIHGVTKSWTRRSDWTELNWTEIDYTRKGVMKYVFQICDLDNNMDNVKTLKIKNYKNVNRLFLN